MEYSLLKKHSLDQQFMQLLILIQDNQADQVKLKSLTNAFGLVIVKLLPHYCLNPSPEKEEQWAETLATINPVNILQFIQLLPSKGYEFNLDNATVIRQFYVRRLYRIAHNKAVDYYRKNPQLLSLDSLISSESRTTHIELISDPTDHWESLMQNELGDRLREIIQDPQCFYRKIHPRRYPQANLAEVLHRRLNGETFQEISQEFQINMGTLTAFWSRRCLPHLQISFHDYHQVA
jgi:hypothetical protein